MDGIGFMMAHCPLVLTPGLKLLQATQAMLKWRTRMRGDVGICYSAMAHGLLQPSLSRNTPASKVQPDVFQVKSCYECNAEIRF
jgi:hypothetical protein